MTNPYRPRADSLAAQCIAFFRANPDEHLLLDDMTDKFGCVRGNIHTLLKPAVEARLLQRARNEDGEYIYQRGSAIDSAPADANPPPLTGKPSPRGYSSAPVNLDIAALQVDDSVPYTPHCNNTGVSKWDPLFDKLSKIGQSVAVPGHTKAALAAAALVRNKRERKANTGREYRVAMTGPGQARVWRVA